MSPAGKAEHRVVDCVKPVTRCGLLHLSSDAHTMEYVSRVGCSLSLATFVSAGTQLSIVLIVAVVTSPVRAVSQTTDYSGDTSCTGTSNSQPSHELTQNNRIQVENITEPEGVFSSTSLPPQNHTERNKATWKQVRGPENTTLQNSPLNLEGSKLTYQIDNETMTPSTSHEIPRNTRGSSFSLLDRVNQQGRPNPHDNRPNGQDPRCSSGSQQQLTDTEGGIVWSEPQTGSCPAVRWLITVPAGNGIVFEFHSFEIANNLTVMIHGINSQTSTPENPPLWVFSSDLENSTMAPLLLRINHVLLEVRRPLSAQALDRSNPSGFNLSYAAHPVQLMPQEVQVDGFRTSSVMYNCSRHPSSIPKGLRCDLIRQCAGGEDEDGCSYKAAGCGDWVPYGGGCLQAFFKPITEHLHGIPPITIPIRAENECRVQYHAKLATLPDELGIRLAGNILRRSGYRSASVGLRKMRPRSAKLKQLYKYMWQWGKRGSPVAYEQASIQRHNAVVDCAAYDLSEDSYLRPIPCSVVPERDRVPDGFFCKKSNSIKRPRMRPKRLRELYYQAAKQPVTVFPTKTCPDGSLVQTFHACSWGEFGTSTESKTPFPRFQCQLGHTVHYSSVCDSVKDCADGSDEINCRPPRLQPSLKTMFTCTNTQTVPRMKHCNGINDCFDNSDEEDCIVCRGGTGLCPLQGCLPTVYRHYFTSCRLKSSPTSTPTPPPPAQIFSAAAVVLDGYGMSDLKPAGEQCEEGYFRCNNHLCIPSFLLNNGEQDCPTGIDEGIPLENLTCPGYYRCHHYGNCVHSRYLCDGIPHCPDKDDEIYCDITCPFNCTCEGFTLKCVTMLNPVLYLNTRYLDISGIIRPQLANIQVMEYLVFLNLSHCKLTYVNLTNMPQLEILDLSFNQLIGIWSVNLNELTGLKRLTLSNNPLMTKIDATFTQFVKSSGMMHLKELAMVRTGLNSIEDGVLGRLTELTHLDLRENDITDFHRDVFSGLVLLESLQADNYKLCCSYFHEETIPECLAPVDELSSCDDLLSSQFFQVSVWVLAVLNIPANMAVLVYRALEMKKKRAKSYTILVANLCLSDLLMGIYLLFIGAADLRYRDHWVSKEEVWTSSRQCCIAGILAFISCEVSAFVVCLITVDRLLVVCFPLRTVFHMTNSSASLACAVSWILGVLLATVPMMASWRLYGQNGFCLPLPITRNQFPGQKYVFAVFVYVNFVLFILIGIGQVCIYRAIKNVRMSVPSQSKLQDMTIARRLMLIIMTDFLCWFPIGLMGVLSSLGAPIPGVVNVWAAIFILPFNSALNPHLYTLNTMLDQYREHRMNRQILKTIGQINTEIPKWPPHKVESLLRSCLQAQVVQKKQVLQWLKLDSGGESSAEEPRCITHGLDNNKVDNEELLLEAMKASNPSLDAAKPKSLKQSHTDVSPSHTQTTQLCS